MSFYITLPSNQGSSENTQSNFTTFLNDSIHLKGNYEVALAEITFSANYNFDFGSLTLEDNDNGTIKFNVKIPNGLKLNDFVWILNKRYSEEVEWIKYVKNHNINKNNRVSKEFHISNFPPVKHDIFLNDNNIIKIRTANVHIIKAEGILHKVFPFKVENNVFHDMSRYLPDKFNIINYIIVYTDIIDFQYFGDKKTQILRSIPITYHNNEIQTNFDNQHYVKVKDTFINSINIQLRDIFGNPIEFDDFFSYVILNLHFRPIE